MNIPPAPEPGLRPGRLVLRPFTAADEPEARRAHEELAQDGFTFLLRPYPDAPWAEYLESLARVREGRDLPEGWVRSAFLAADVDGLLVGRASVRFTLTEWLERWGGHIGYAVRPAFRRRGLATEILRRSCALLAARGVDRALVTCDEGNVGSATVIERCGGVLEDVVDDPDGPPKRRYWIDLRPSPAGHPEAGHPEAGHPAG